MSRFYSRGGVLYPFTSGVWPERASIRLSVPRCHDCAVHHSHEFLSGGAVVRRGGPDLLPLDIGKLHHCLWAIPQGQPRTLVAAVLIRCLSPNQPRWRQTMFLPCCVEC